MPLVVIVVGNAETTEAQNYGRQHEYLFDIAQIITQERSEVTLSNKKFLQTVSRKYGERGNQ